MTQTAKACAAAMLTVLCSAWCRPAGAQAPAKTSGSQTVVLDTMGFWRMHQTLRAPVARTEGGLTPLLLKAPWVDRSTQPPAADWMQPDFDDSGWLRGTALLAPTTPYQARLCLRGRFTVSDPAKVRGLKLAAVYHGGAVVYLNGKELTRANMAAGSDELAEDYPAEAFRTPQGGLLTFEAARRTLRPDDPRRRQIGRELDVAIPSRLLRRGVNVLAIQIARAPYPKIVDDKKDAKRRCWNFAWDTCQIETVRLSAAATGGLTPNVARPSGFQVWNSDLLAGDYDLDYGDRNEKLRPIRIVGARNGCFSGKVVAGDTKPIRNLKAAASDLRGAAGVIPAAQVRVRYGLPWGDDTITIPYARYAYPLQADLLGRLCDRAPAEIPVRTKQPPRRRPGTPEHPKPLFGAVAPIWVTVRVPTDAAPGRYAGSITIQAAGQRPVTVPVELTVADWTLPDSQDYRTSVEIIQSPDTLATEYGAGLWSDRHWELIAESFRLLCDSGNRIVYVPLIAETNFGHGQSMVRWIPKADGRYEYDLAVMDKYLDLAARHMGTPKIVVFYAWDVYMLGKGGGSGANQSEQRNLVKGLQDRGALLDRGPMVTVADPAAGTTRNVILPKYTDPAAKAQWGPLFEQIRRHLARRGLEKAMMLGMLTDAWPTKEEVAVLVELSGGVPWVAHAHFGGGGSVYRLAKVGSEVRVWGISPPGAKSLMGWKLKPLRHRYFRQGGFDSYPPSTWRFMSEYAIAGDQRGVGRLGGEFWKVLKDKRGQRAGRIYEQYPHSNWRNLDIYASLLAPGPEGPTATQHYQHLVEGIQECEARIAIERALSDTSLRARLGDDLAKRCQELLDDRMRCAQACFCRLMNRLDGNPAGLSSTGGPGVAGHFWSVGSGWQKRAERLFTLAGEVERKVSTQKP